jgi:RNA polymerase sigma-70 factor (ECF subfamily)
VTEIELLNSIKTQPEAFSALFKLYYKAIFGYILRRTGNFDDAADIAADTFFKAYQQIGKFTYRGVSIKVWLYRIATNEVNQYFRHRQKTNVFFIWLEKESETALTQFLDEDRKNWEAELQGHTQYLTVLKNLKTLPNSYQDVIALRYFEGKDNKEITEILGIKEGTLKSLLSRGIEKLRKKCNQP